MLENEHVACQIPPVDISKRKPVVAAVTGCPPCDTCPHFDKGGRMADTARTIIRARDPGCTTTDPEWTSRNPTVEEAVGGALAARNVGR